MTLKQITLAIFLTITLATFLARPSILSLLLTPFLFFLSWLAITGPSFKVSVRHPDIRRRINSQAMQTVLLRPFLTPATLHTTNLLLLPVALLLPSVVVGLWPLPFMTQYPLWWMLLTPLILCASTPITEAILMQIVAMPFVGSLIALLLIFAPSGARLSSSDPATVTFWLPSLIFLTAVLYSLWLLDLLRACHPHSERRRRLTQP